VKLLKPALFDSNQDVTDFIKEGVVLRKIKHPCVGFGSPSRQRWSNCC
jgi:hypothetical protein